MGLELEYGQGQTPINEEEKEGLLLKHISTQGELNEAEQLNIEEAVEWTLRNRFIAEEILSEKFVRELHKRMYRHVWKWAGTFRHSDKSIGVDWKQVPVNLRGLLDDCLYWVENNSFPEDEIAVRFKHRIVSIHCFPTGNGRHSRLMADVIRSHIFRKPPFTWGSGNLSGKGPNRVEYISALKEADRGSVVRLVEFAKG